MTDSTQNKNGSAPPLNGGTQQPSVSLGAVSALGGDGIPVLPGIASPGDDGTVGFSTPRQFGSVPAFSSSLLPAAPGRQPPYHTAATVSLAPGLGVADTTAHTIPMRQPSPTQDAKLREMALAAHQAADTTPAADPGAVASSPISVIDDLVQRYTIVSKPVELAPDGQLDVSGRDANPGSTRFSLLQRVVKIRELRAQPSFFSQIGSTHVLVVGLIGQLEFVVEDLHVLLGMAYALLAVPEAQRQLADDWHKDMIAMINDDFPSYGIALRVFAFVVKMVDYAAAVLEALLHMRPSHSVPSPPEMPNFDLSGYATSFANLTAGQAADVTITPATAQRDTAEAAQRPSPSDKDATALYKWHNPPVPLFRARNNRVEARRATHAYQPFDFSQFDALGGLGSIDFAARFNAAPGTTGDVRQEAVAQAVAHPPVFDRSLPALAPAAPPALSHSSIPTIHSSSLVQRGSPLPPGGLHSNPFAHASPTGSLAQIPSAGSAHVFVPPNPPPPVAGGGAGGAGDPYGPPPPFLNGGWNGLPPNGLGGTGGGFPPGPPSSSGFGGPPSQPGNGYPGAMPPGGGPPDRGPPGGDPFFPPEDGGGLRGAYVDERIKYKDLPEWDGSEHSALEYFSKLTELAISLRGWIPVQIGRLAPLQFTGRLLLWWRNFSGRAAIQANYITLIHGLRRFYLSDKFSDRLLEEYNRQEFRQRGHAGESPFDFIIRRALLIRVLYGVGQQETINMILAVVPKPWLWLLGGNIATVDDLMMRAQSMEAYLVSGSQATNAPDIKSLVNDAVAEALRATNGVQRASAPTQQRYNSSNPFRAPGYAQPPPAAAARFADVEAGGLELAPPTTTGQPYSSADAPVLPSTHGALAHVVQVYLAAKAKSRPPPPGGYQFPKSDKESARAPPSPCKVCGGELHWDKECPHYPAYELKRRQGVLFVNSERPPDEDRMYASLYDVVLNESLSAYAPIGPAELSSDETVAPSSVLAATARPAVVEEEEDEFVRWYRESPKASGVYLAELVDQLAGERKLGYCESSLAKPAAVLLAPSTLLPDSRPGEGDNDGLPELLPEDDTDDEDEDAICMETIILSQAMSAEDICAEAGPPPPDSVVRVYPRRAPPEGYASLGVSVLSCRGRAGSLEDKPVTLRLDSGASISLVSEAFLRSLKTPPKIKQGMKVKITQLTSGAPDIQGYVHLPIFIEAEDGAWLEFRAEVYVIPAMTVDVLLGEDFQLLHELDTLRSMDRGTRILVGRTGRAFKATSLSRDTDDAESDVKGTARGFRVVHENAASFVRAKSHRRARARRHRAKRTLALGALRAFEDVLVPPETTVPVTVAGNLRRDRDWFVERNLVPNGDDTFLVVPNALLSSHRDATPPTGNAYNPVRTCILQVSNPTRSPRMLRSGTLLGYATDPDKTLDKPASEQDYERMRTCAETLVVLVAALDDRDLGQDDAPPVGVYSTLAQRPDNSVQKERHIPCAEELAELDPPATAEAPDPTLYSSKDLEDILDLSPDLPPDVRAKALEMLRKHVLAFGFDGRLGHLRTNARVRTKPDVEPISVPTHGASPEKRQIIEEQLAKWFELGVIEDSISPWAAPVVIVYRNGKPRFCVDYRKLNAATIADEFPIPRQSDILSALSGSQVLSSLDALAGFNQMEIAKEDVEKTAFRTHKGLFQFKRMPFGLRNGPAIFQRVMQGILAPFLWLFTLVYIDDIVVYSATYADHLEHLDKVLGAIEKAGLTLSPAKCHFFYSSIMLLGHKVSRLGLSTHQEKVEAITALGRPTKVALLQTFLGMVVYFQAFIPYYSFIVSPLFKLLRKDVPWSWGADEEYAFEEAKAALQRAPVLGHPVRGRPYRLYTDASDEAMGACLQQVQDIRVGDLVGTQTYDRLRKAFDAGEPIPRLVSKVSNRIVDVTHGIEGAERSWASTLDDSTVEVERVIAYWSRTFKSAEKNYTVTEREALAAKDALIKFQPFIEGEKIILITDHSALQWARTFENTNRRLAAWGAVFGAYLPNLEIVHRAGRLHSNVDPLSRLPRDEKSSLVRGAPDFISPARDTTPAIQTNVDAAELRERLAGSVPAPRLAFANFAHFAVSLDELLEPIPSGAAAEVFVATRRQRAKEAAAKRAREEPPTLENPSLLPAKPLPDEALPFSVEVQGSQPGQLPRAPMAKMRYEDRLEWEADNAPPTLLVSMSPEYKKRFVAGYAKDPNFAKKGNSSDERSWYAGNRFYKGRDGLLFFRDADFMPRLCVPKSEQGVLLRQIHESAVEAAHAGADKLYLRMATQFYWPRMKKDVAEYCASCDVCQKNKAENFKRFGKLQPHDVPEQPFSRISLDLVTGLPWTGLYNAILVIVDLLTKHASFIPTDTGLSSEGFAKLFVKHIACRFGLPLDIIADRDGRWLSLFWAAVSREMGVHMMLSSSHHPQHDGQTERTNRTLETMLRHYVAADSTNWDQWLPMLEFSYNCSVHSASKLSPYYHLYGYQPRTPASIFASGPDGSIPRTRTAHDGADEFLTAMRAHRQSARDALANSKHQQSQAFNVGRRDLVFKPDDLVLLKPRSLELIESKGVGSKLVQRAIGPFAVQERVSDATYRIDLPPQYPMSNVIHISHLKKYIPSPARFGERSTLDIPRFLETDSEEYQVEKIVAHRNNRRRKQVEFLVRWEGFGPQHDSWLTAKELRNAPARLLDYRRQYGV